MKVFQGIVKSVKMDKTAVVEVSRMWKHPLYRKRVKKTKKYMVHDEKNQAEIGNRVTFRESAPISKNKRFILVSIKKDN
jgi:small subunit ribosomal protein S17